MKHSPKPRSGVGTSPLRRENLRRDAVASPLPPAAGWPTAADIAALRSLLEKATPGPWEARSDSVIGPQSRSFPHANPTMNRMHICSEADRDDAVFIAAARNAMPALLAQLTDPEQAAAVATGEQDKPSSVCTSPLPTTLEELETLKRIAWGEGYAVGCLAEKALREALAEMLKVNAAMARVIAESVAEKADIMDLLEEEMQAAGIADGFGARARSALSTSNDSGARQE